MKKKVLSVILAAVCTMGLMAGCGAEGSKGSTQSGAKGDSYTVGISQFAEHGSLDNCREGFLEGLKEEGIEEGKNLKVDYQNAQTDTGTASTIADSFVSEKVDMICAIATPCAASAYNSAMNADIPTVYTAVSDPVVAGLAKKDGSSVGNITGSSDVLPVEEQLKMIREMMPDAKKITIPKSVKWIEPTAFKNTSIKTLKVSKKNKYFAVHKRCLYRKAEKELVYVFGKGSKLILSKKIKQISEDVVVTKTKLKKLIISHKVKLYNNWKKPFVKNNKKIKIYYRGKRVK